MLLFNDNLLTDYKAWKKANGDNFSWWNYVNMKADINTALAFAKFFSPEILDVDGCIILKDRFSNELYSSWKKDCNNDKNQIEKMMNLYQIADFFEMNSNSVINKEKIVALGEVLKYYWNISFKNQFPEKFIEVEVFEEDDGELFITVYQRI